ncbi:MAG: ATP synthase F1 subunit gamma [Acidobacteriota bacterium]
MPTLLDYRRKIRSIKNTQQMTSAMKTVSAAKLKRTQKTLLSSRPYSEKLKDVIRSLSSRVVTSLHPLLEVREEKSVDVVIVTGDKGLCGAFNSNIIKFSHEFIEEKTKESKINLILIGKKGRDFFRKRPYPIRHVWIDLFFKINYEKTLDISKKIIELYENRKTDAIYVIYNKFESLIRQKIVWEKLLPVPKWETEEVMIDYIYEPEPREIFNELMPKYVEFLVFNILMESATAEHSARMMAMEQATKNAGDLIENLTLIMNKIRQASITKELIDIMTASEALAKSRI